MSGFSESRSTRFEQTTTTIETLILDASKKLTGTSKSDAGLSLVKCIVTHLLSALYCKSNWNPNLYSSILGHHSERLNNNPRGVEM